MPERKARPPTASPSYADEVVNLVRAYQPACVIAAAAELDIFTALSSCPMTAAKLAQRLRTDTRATTVLLDALAALGFLIKNEAKYQVPPHIAAVLAEVSPDNVLPAIRHHANCLRRWAELARVVKTGKPAERAQSIAGPQADLAAFIGAMDNFARAATPQLVKKLRPLKFCHLLDIGGGPGTWTIAFLQGVTDATATLFDLPDVIPLAEKRIAQAGLTRRVTLVAGNYNTDDLPAGADLAWLSAVAHQNSREQNRALFTKIYRALLPAGILIIRDAVMASSRTSPQAGALFAINMLVSTEAGGTYTFDEFCNDLSSVGFTDVRLLHRDPAMHSLIRAAKSI